MADWSNAEYTLYSHPFSLYSMMARHTIHLGPTTPGATPPKEIALVYVDHRKNDNLREDYLRVNPKGQVPTLAGDVLEKPLTDSHAISLYLAEKHYPAMLPATHAAVIKDLLARLHAVPGLSISNKNPTAEMMQYNPSPVEEILKRTDLSEEYRKALEAKLEFHKENNGVAFRPNVVAKARSELQAIFADVLELHRRQTLDDDSDAEWIFGADVGPTVLDSHLLPVVLRCVDVGNDELVPRQLLRWAGIEGAKGPTWRKVMHGRPTKWDASMGPVADMEEFRSL